MRARRRPRPPIALATLAAAMIGWAATDGALPAQGVVTAAFSDTALIAAEPSTSRGRVAAVVPMLVVAPAESLPPAATPSNVAVAAPASPGSGSAPATVATERPASIGGGVSAGAAAVPAIVPPRRSASPTIAPPPPLVPGATRLSIRVYDGVTSAPIADACVIVGTTDCGPQRLRTDALGRWYADARPTKGTTWEVRIVAPGYRTEVRIVVTQSEAELVSTFRLRRA